MSRLLIAAPLRFEELLIRSGAPRAKVRHTGMGPGRARAAADALLGEQADALLVLGFCGGLDDRATPGEVVVAERVLGAPDDAHSAGSTACAGAQQLSHVLADAGLRVRCGALVSVSRLALGERRAQLLALGAIAVDMESAWLATGAGSRPFAVVRVVLDSPTHELLRPQAALAALRAGRALRRVARALQDWPSAG